MPSIDAPARSAARWLPTGRVLVIGAALVVVVNSALLFVSLSRLSEATSWVKHTLTARQMMEQAVVELMTAEAMQRTYLITGNSGSLMSYARATDSALDLVSEIETLVRDNPDQVQRIGEIRTLLRNRFSQLQTAFAERQRVGLAEVPGLLEQSNNGTTTSQIRSAFREMASSEDALLVERQEIHEESQANAYVSMVVFIGTTLFLIVFSVLFMRRELRDRKASEKQIQSYAEDLDASVKELKSERNEISLVNELSNFLQACNSLDEVAALIDPFFNRLFPGYSGAFRVYAESRNQLRLVSAWGDSKVHDYIGPDDCWSLRRGQIHIHDPEVSGPACAHCEDEQSSGRYSICVPLQAFGETLGLLSIERPGSVMAEGRAEAAVRLADLVGRQLGLTLASLRLRQTLNEQSIRDPLTNAFNRRYLETLASKEIAQATRHGRNLVIVMLDIDHFKKFNDLHGHQAGDATLVSVVGYLNKTIREGDWLFRYGGEEFLILLRDVDAEDALLKIEELRAGIEQLSIECHGEALPNVTASMGVAMFPDHGSNFTELVSLADEALYAAKRAGRNCVLVAEPSAQEVDESEPEQRFLPQAVG